MESRSYSQEELFSLYLSLIRLFEEETLGGLLLVVVGYEEWLKIIKSTGYQLNITFILPGVAAAYLSWHLSDMVPDSKVHGTNMGPLWGWQDLGERHVGPMNFAVWVIQSI